MTRPGKLKPFVEHACKPLTADLKRRDDEWLPTTDPRTRLATAPELTKKKAALRDAFHHLGWCGLSACAKP